MRTTLDLPDELLDIARSVAQDTHQTLSQTVAQLLRIGLGKAGGGDDSPRIYISPRTGLPVLHLSGGLITVEDVRALDDDE